MNHVVWMGLLCFRNLKVNFSPCPDYFSKNSTNSLGTRLVQLGVEYTQAEHCMVDEAQIYMHRPQLHLHEQTLSSSCNFAGTSIGHAVYWIMKVHEPWKVICTQHKQEHMQVSKYKEYRLVMSNTYTFTV